MLSIIALLTVATAFAQNKQPDAEYNLIRRSYRTVGDSITEIRFHKEIVLLRNRAITAYADKGETFITYNPDFETLTVNECYTVRPDGVRVNTPDNAFVRQLPSECADCGRLNHITELAIVHTALEYNCTIVLDYTLRRRSPLLVERFNLSQDCPVKRYEIRYADGHTDVHNNIAQTVNDPYMPAAKAYDVEFQLGSKPVYTAETSLPEAANLLASLKANGSKEYVAAIRDWVVDYVTLNPIDPARVNYAMTPANEVFSSNCGTAIDKTGLLAAMLNQAGFRASIVDNSLNVFGDKPLEVEVVRRSLTRTTLPSTTVSTNSSKSRSRLTGLTLRTPSSRTMCVSPSPRRKADCNSTPRSSTPPAPATSRPAPPPNSTTTPWTCPKVPS